MMAKDLLRQIEIWSDNTNCPIIDEDGSPIDPDSLVTAVKALESENAELQKRVAELEAMKEKKGGELWSAAQEHYDARCVLEKRVTELECALRHMNDVHNLMCAEASSLQSQLAWTPVRPICAHCGARATCHGSYEDQPEAYACDACCLHGCEDGRCEPVSDGLPTEPGFYLFSPSAENGCSECYLVFRFTGVEWLCQKGIDDINGEPVEETWWVDQILGLGGGFRRIELPKDGES